MKLADINKDFKDAVDKYTIAKSGVSNVSKEIGTDGEGKNDMGRRSGSQDTPVSQDKQKLLGTNPLGSRDKVMPTNLAV